jgi:hypothetical protein
MAIIKEASRTRDHCVAKNATLRAQILRSAKNAAQDDNQIAISD